MSHFCFSFPVLISSNAPHPNPVRVKYSERRCVEACLHSERLKALSRTEMFPLIPLLYNVLDAACLMFALKAGLHGNETEKQNAVK